MDVKVSFNKLRNDSIEYFRPFGKVMTTIAQFVPLNILHEVSQSFANRKVPAIVKQIIVAASYLGQIKVFYHIIELPQ
jgi:hypothetical protein